MKSAPDTPDDTHGPQVQDSADNGNHSEAVAEADIYENDLCESIKKEGKFLEDEEFSEQSNSTESDRAPFSDGNNVINSAPVSDGNDVINIAPFPDGNDVINRAPVPDGNDVINRAPVPDGNDDINQLFPMQQTLGNILPDPRSILQQSDSNIQYFEHNQHEPSSSRGPNLVSGNYDLGNSSVSRRRLIVSDTGSSVRGLNCGRFGPFSISSVRHKSASAAHYTTLDPIVRADLEKLTRSLLNAQMNDYTSYICPICFYNARMRYKFDRHLGQHLNHRTFCCSYCGYRTVLKPSLVVHMRKHTGERPYKCHLCDYSSAQKSNLDCHMRKHGQSGQM